MKNYLIVTGGAGFVGSNLIYRLLKTTKFKIISVDNYSSGNKKNHILNNRVKYYNADTRNISKVLNNYKSKINCLFHFGEFSRIYQSFIQMDKCIESNSIGTNEVFNFCLKNKIRLIYSATSATIGNNGNDKNLSPYAFSKSKNLELLENLKRWFNFKYEVIFFYNVYGKNQIENGKMATVIGIFEHQFKNQKYLTVVKPGTQTRRFTHIDDTIDACLLAYKQNKNRYYSISNKKSYSIIQVARMFNKKIKYLKSRPGERYASALTNVKFSRKVFKLFGKVQLNDYINRIVKQ